MKRIGVDSRTSSNVDASCCGVAIGDAVRKGDGIGRGHGTDHCNVKAVAWQWPKHVGNLANVTAL